ncbi:ABC transporter ATP-binding protein [Georgenia sp. Z1344]|uniref:ABC transporter ATP-binding protein n=1 Tax=Georgenia sp. Z1344 TaxID=3416706 RepID=UPI003CE8A550
MPTRPTTPAVDSASNSSAARSAAPDPSRASASAAGLTLEHVTLTYPDGGGRLTAVDDVSLSVPAGTTTALLGPSGSGKSSLLAVAATLTLPDAGLVRIGDRVVTGGGRSLGERERAELRRTSIGIVFQQPRLLPSLTAIEQLTVRTHMRGGDMTAARERAARMLTRVGLGSELGRRPHQLSGGQRQRVNIARALVGDPAVLLVDEPTSALDHERGTQIVDLVTELTRAAGAATLLVSHDESTLGGVDAVARIADGRLLEPALAAA